MSTWRPSQPSASDVDPRRVGEHLELLTRSFGGPRVSTLSAVFAHWEELVGPEIAEHSQPKSLRDGVLAVVVDQPAWAAQLGYLAPDLLAKLAEVSAPGEVEDIRFQVVSAIRRQR